MAQVRQVRTAMRLMHVLPTENMNSHSPNKQNSKQSAFAILSGHRSGFTLIEILITTIIMAVFSALSLAGYRSFQEQQKLEKATKHMVEVLELAKKMATNGQIPPPTDSNPYGYDATKCGTPQENQGCHCKVFTGEYKIWFVPHSSFVIYKMGGVGKHPSEGCFYMVDLPPSTITPDTVRISHLNDNWVGTGYYGFQAFGLGVKSFYSNPPLNPEGGFSVTLKNSVTGQTKKIIVNRAGTISVQ